MHTKENLSDDEKGVSITTGYVIHLGIAVIAIGTMVFMFNNAGADITRSTQETQLSVVGEKIASEIVAADRLSNTGSEPEGSVEIDLDAFNDRMTYTVNVTEDTGTGDSGVIIVSSGSADATINYSTTTPMKKSEFGSGSNIEVVYDENELVIE